MKMILVPALAVAVSSAALAQQSTAADRAAVEAVLSNYKSSIERLDATGTKTLFASDAQIFETGGSEGTYANYLAHHLGPELGHFRSFKFSDYKVSIRFEGPVALATETYRYTIEPKTGAPIERLGVATSVLKKVGGRWQILSMHNSSRKPRGS
jgi:ketosteroid isomerase-like protein